MFSPSKFVRWKVFIRPVDTIHGEVYYNDIEEPFIARHVAVEGVTDQVHYNGIRMEFYGCGKYSINI